MLRGEVGVGKTALLDYAAERASGCRLARVGGVESETGFTFAGLLDLVGGPMLERAEQLPVPQRDALRRAFGLVDGPAPEGFLVSLAALTLLSQVAEEAPLVCLVDDAQWLDRESISALSFVARRLAAERIGMLFAVREPMPSTSSTACRSSCSRDSATPTPGCSWTRRCRVGSTSRFASESSPRRGATRSRCSSSREGWRRPSWPAVSDYPTSASCRTGSSRRSCGACRRCRRRRRELCSCAAAEAVGDATVIARAAGRLRVGAADPSEPRTPIWSSSARESGSAIRSCGRPRIGSRRPTSGAERMRHSRGRPTRSEIPTAESGTERTRRPGPTRAAWPRVRAFGLAGEGPRWRGSGRRVPRACGRAQPRPGAARHTRARGGAAEADAGALEAAERLLTVATTSPLEELDRGRAQRLSAHLAFAPTPGRDTPSLLSAAAKRLEPLDPELARETHLEALWAVRSGFAESTEVVAAAQAATLPAGQQPARAIDLLLDGVLARLTRGYEPALPAVAHALAAFRAEGFSRENLAWCWLACSSRWTSGRTTPAKRSAAASVASRARAVG